MNHEMRLTHELLKLLVQLAWADDVISPFESEHILFIARAAALDKRDLEELELALQGQGKPPVPDLGLLRGHREEALSAAKVLLMSDDEMTGSEVEMLEQLSELLT
jgi:hypothetical protein